MKIRVIAHSLGNRVVLQALNILNQVRIAYPGMWHKLLTSVDLMYAAVSSSSVRPGGELHNGLMIAAYIHSYYSSLDSLLYFLEFGDNLSPTNSALGHTNAYISSIYSINVTPIIGADHHAYISPRIMNLLTDHWDHHKLFGSVNFGPVFNSFCYPGIQNCTAGKSLLMNIRNSSSICNPAFSNCSSAEQTTKANTDYVTRDNLT